VIEKRSLLTVSSSAAESYLLRGTARFMLYLTNADRAL
jgi:hypothetical protein